MPKGRTSHFRKASSSPPMLTLRRRARGEEIPRRPDRRLARCRLRRGDPLRRKPCHGECRRWEGRAAATPSLAAGQGGLAAGSTNLPNARVSMSRPRGDDGSQPGLCAAPRSLGRRRLSFATRAEFVEAIEAGGVAAMEVLARTCGRSASYTARSAFPRRRRIRDPGARPQPRGSAASTTPMPGLRHHPQQPRRRDGGGEHHRRERHPEPPGQIGRALRF